MKRSPKKTIKPISYEDIDLFNHTLKEVLMLAEGVGLGDLSPAFRHRTIMDELIAKLYTKLKESRARVTVQEIKYLVGIYRLLLRVIEIREREGTKDDIKRADIGGFLRKSSASKQGEEP